MTFIIKYLLLPPCSTPRFAFDFYDLLFYNFIKTILEFLTPIKVDSTHL